MEANVHLDETSLRRASERGELNELLPRVYDELRAVAHRMMCGERVGHTLQTTALVHEAYVRLLEQRNLTPADHGPFLAAAANTIRRVLVDHARQRPRKGHRRRQACALPAGGLTVAGWAVGFRHRGSGLARSRAPRAALVLNAGEGVGAARRPGGKPGPPPGRQASFSARLPRRPTRTGSTMMATAMA